MVLHLQGGCRVVPGQKICRKQQLEGTRQGKIKDLWMKLSCFRCYKNSLVLPFGTVHKSKTIMKLNLILIGKDGHCVAFEDDSWRAVSTQRLQSFAANPCCHHFILQIVLMNVHWCTRHCGTLSGNTHDEFDTCGSLCLTQKLQCGSWRHSQHCVNCSKGLSS